MSRSLFKVEKGLRLLKENLDYAAGNGVDILFDAGAPAGTSGQTDEAKVGSIYTDTTNGNAYIKKTDTSSASDWAIFLTDPDSTLKQEAVVGAAAVELDSVLVDDILACEWEVHVSENSSPENIKVIKVMATHDGTAAADATATDDSAYAKLKLGANFTYDIDVDINGTGAGQTMRLMVTGSAGSALKFTSRRNDIKAP